MLCLLYIVFGPNRYINANGLHQNASLLAIVEDLNSPGLMDLLLEHGVSRVSAGGCGSGTGNLLRLY